MAQEKFGYSWDELKGKCDSKGASFFPKIEEVRDQYDMKSAGVKDDVLNEANKYCPMTDEKWNELINQKCFTNQSLISVAHDAIDSVQLCLDTKDGLSDEETVNAKRELLERFCSIIKTWYVFIHVH